MESMRIQPVGVYSLTTARALAKLEPYLTTVPPLTTLTPATTEPPTPTVSETPGPNWFQWAAWGLALVVGLNALGK